MLVVMKFQEAIITLNHTKEMDQYKKLHMDTKEKAHLLERI